VQGSLAELPDYLGQGTNCCSAEVGRFMPIEELQASAECPFVRSSKPIVAPDRAPADQTARQRNRGYTSVICQTYWFKLVLPKSKPRSGDGDPWGPVAVEGSSMVQKQSAYSDESTRIETGPRAEEAASVEQGIKSQRRDSTLVPPADRGRRRKRTLLMGLLGALVLAGMWVFGVPWIQLTLNTVSTDDAYVNGHVTFVAARVSGQVTRVLVDDNNRVHKGDLLVQLDKEPYRDAVAVKRAAVDVAKADLQAATAAVRALEAQARGLRWKLKYAMEDVDNRVALLQARVAALDKNKATLKFAQVEFARAEKLLPTADISREEYDRRQAALSVAQAEVTQAMADVYQIRVSLGLAAQPESGDLGEVPPHLDQTFASVRDAQAALIQTAAQLGVIHSYEQLPKQMVEQFEKRDQGDIDRALAGLTADAPAVKQAQAKLESANRDLTQAELDLRYCDVVAEIDGVVTRRNVNPGNNVQVGQSLMAIRSLSEIWVDANFKETQLRDLRIGQPVDLYVDMYGSRHVFKGRVSGFTEGTGSTLALLPPENATGNFIKVVQRLPVRIELEGYDPNKNPLFIGTSVVPYVYLNKPLTGPDAGKFLQTITNR
jgi:membrane fusion protein, multidrug efflux system